LRIRASQGHSISVDLGLEPVEPPAVLYHGTADRFIPSIRAKGLLAGRSDHVHLSAEEATAVKVGQRHGRPVVLRVRAAEMHQAGHLFYLSANRVWLVGHVPAGFLLFPESVQFRGS
jgi:putative RNA 2'-phosphotransferase